MNYFEWFEMPFSLKVDMQQVTRKYMQMQRKFHPDYHVDANEAEQMEMLEKTSELNKAYAIFKNRDATIKYYLQLTGKWNEGQTEVLSPAFLMEMMDINESLDDGGDTKQILEEVNSKIEQQYSEIEPIMLRNHGEISNKDVESLIMYLNQKKYLNRILDRLTK